MTKAHRRKRVFADWKIQGGLCLRVTFYWLTCQAMLVLTAFALDVLGGGTGVSLWSYLLPACVASLLVLPIALLDLLIFSNRFAGPWYRFRKQFDRMADGQAVERLQFRSGDWSQDLSANFNCIRERLLQDDRVPDGTTDNETTDKETGSMKTQPVAVN